MNFYPYLYFLYVLKIVLFDIFTENILKYYRIFDMYIPQKMMDKQASDKKLFISNAIDKIRKNLEMDKYKDEIKQIGKN